MLAELILRGEISYEDLERHPEFFTDRLPENLKEYLQVSDLVGKDWESVRGICDRCNPLPVNPTAPKAPATKMANIARREV